MLTRRRRRGARLRAGSESGRGVLARDVLPARGSHPPEGSNVLEQGRHGFRELLGLEAGEDAAAARVAHELLGAARRGRHDGHAAGERLGRDDPEPLLPGGQDEERRLAQGLGDRVDEAERVDALGHRARAVVRSAAASFRERARGSAAAPRAGAAGSCAGRRRGRRRRASAPRAGASQVSSGSGARALDVDRDRQDPDLGLVTLRGSRDRRPRSGADRVDARRLADQAPLEPAQDERVHSLGEPTPAIEPARPRRPLVVERRREPAAVGAIRRAARRARASRAGRRPRARSPPSRWRRAGAPSEAA